MNVSYLGTLVVTSVLATMLFTGCGAETREDSVSVALNSSNYIKVAKSAYAQQNGEETTLRLEAVLPPGEELDAGTLYLTKVVKPRNTRISALEIQQGENTLFVTVDEANKYATVTLKGSESAQEVVDMKTFTLTK
jgi:hypothetical protein